MYIPALLSRTHLLGFLEQHSTYIFLCYPFSSILGAFTTTCQFFTREIRESPITFRFPLPLSLPCRSHHCPAL